MWVFHTKINSDYDDEVDDNVGDAGADDNYIKHDIVMNDTCVSNYVYFVIFLFLFYIYFSFGQMGWLAGVLSFVLK